MKELIHQFILRALLAKEGQPMSELELKLAIRGTFASVAFTEADLTQRIHFCEAQGWIAGMADTLLGSTLWGLTFKGRHAALLLTP